MKKIMFMTLLTICLSANNLILAATQPRPGYLDEPVRIEIIGNIKDGERYPLVVFLPFTSGSAAGYFSRVRPYVGLENYFAVIPQGTAAVEDYLPDFYSYVGWFEKRLMTDLKEILNRYPIDADRIYINGFSLGGDLSWALLIRQKELFAGALILGSRCSYAPSQKDLKYLKDHKKRIVLLIGDDDSPERVSGMINASKLAEKNGLSCWHWKFGGDHMIPGNDMKKAYDLLMGRNGDETAATVPQTLSVEAKAAGAIIMYGRDGCGVCRAMRKNLDREGIAYTFYDVDANGKKSAEMWQKVHDSYPDTKNVRFPVMDIYGLILIGPSFEEVRMYR